MPRVVGVIQARTGSTRLPRKVLRDLGGKPVLAWVVQAARTSGVCDEVVVATTREPDDDEVVALASALGARVVRGPVEDVLTRFIMATEASGADIVVRLTSDCPLIDPEIIATCVHEFDPSHVDYVTTDHDATVGHGFDVEVFGAQLLRELDAIAHDHDRTHVTSYVYSHPDAYRVARVELDPPSLDLRVTLDEPADADLLDEIVSQLGVRASEYEAVVALLRSRPDLVAINAAVRVKPLAAG
jgi:spore coat polysaccharide biosynthesis protein SpsF